MFLRNVGNYLRVSAPSQLMFIAVRISNFAIFHRHNHVTYSYTVSVPLCRCQIRPLPQDKRYIEGVENISIHEEGISRVMRMYRSKRKVCRGCSEYIEVVKNISIHEEGISRVMRMYRSKRKVYRGCLEYIDPRGRYVEGVENISI
jgi:hypothetical protein